MHVILGYYLMFGKIKQLLTVADLSFVIKEVSDNVKCIRVLRA